MLPTTLTPAAVSRVKAILFCIALIPLLRLFVFGFLDMLGANPIEFVIRSFGTWALTFLLITLTVTPLRKFTGANWLVQLRRMFGLYAFFYALMHMLSYVWLDQWFDWAEIGKNIAKHPFIIAGFSSFVLLIPLAATSTNAMMKHMKRNWQKLHYLVYPIAMLGVLHYFWLVKKDITQPVIYAVILTILLGIRVVWRLQQNAAK
ncbi:MAG: sulfoxide reductase heme-binding subunit YedZ [Methylophilales bacterium]|nr:sulfoxide reductase heme-binding subunit YedZ [Methylophilales bacterium]